MSNHFKGQHLDFGGGESGLLSRKAHDSTLYTHLTTINRTNQAYKFSPSSHFRWIRILKAILSSNNSWCHCVWVLEYRVRSVMAGPPNAAELHVHPWEEEVEHRGISGEQTVQDYFRKQSDLSILRKSSHSKQSQLYSFCYSPSLTRDCRTLQDKDKYLWPTTANIKIMSFGKTSNL